MRHGCAVTNDLNRNLAAWDFAEAKDEAIEARAEELLKDPRFVYDFLGDIGADLRGQALKEAQRQLKEEAQCLRVF